MTMVSCGRFSSVFNFSPPSRAWLPRSSSRSQFSGVSLWPVVWGPGILRIPSLFYVPGETRSYPRNFSFRIVVVDVLHVPPMYSSTMYIIDSSHVDVHFAGFMDHPRSTVQLENRSNWKGCCVCPEHLLLASPFSRVQSDSKDTLNLISSQFRETDNLEDRSFPIFVSGSSEREVLDPIPLCSL